MDVLTGHRRNLHETVSTNPEAEVALTKLQRQVDENKHPRSAITLAEAIDQWLDVVKLEETTRDRYEDLIRPYILPTFGTMQAGKVDAELLERLYIRLERCRALCKGRPPKRHVCRPLSTSTTTRFTSSSGCLRAGRAMELPERQPRRAGQVPPSQRRPNQIRHPPPRRLPC